MGGAETTGSQVGRTLPYACRASPLVTGGEAGGRSGSESRGNVRTRGKGERGDEELGEDVGEYLWQTKWDRVVELVHMDFWGKVLAEEATYQAVVLLLKRGTDYHGKGLVEVVWKAVAVILNCCFTASIT